VTRNDSDWLHSYFSASSRDLTPVSVRHAAQLLYVPVSHDLDVTKRCASVLSDSEFRCAERFSTQNNRALFKQRRAFRRFCGALALGSSLPLSHITFEETEKGQPYLSDLPSFSFSFSSCRLGFVGAWSSACAIGIDLEEQTKPLEAVELARQFFSGAEANTVKEVDDRERLRTFFQLWSLKEAALKSIGEGLPFGLDAFEFELTPNLRVVHAPPGHGELEQFSAHLIEGADSCAALVLRSQL